MRGIKALENVPFKSTQLEKQLSTKTQKMHDKVRKVKTQALGTGY